MSALELTSAVMGNDRAGDVLAVGSSHCVMFLGGPAADEVGVADASAEGAARSSCAGSTCCLVVDDTLTSFRVKGLPTSHNSKVFYHVAVVLTIFGGRRGQRSLSGTALQYQSRKRGIRK